MIVNDWFGWPGPGTRCQGDWPARQPSTPAWFLDSTRENPEFLGRRRFVYPWVMVGATRRRAGDVLVFTDDDTDKTIDLLIACLLAGCGYSVCDTADEISVRTNAITEHGDGTSGDSGRWPPPSGCRP